MRLILIMLLLVCCIACHKNEVPPINTSNTNPPVVDSSLTTPEKFPKMDKAKLTAMHKWQHTYFGDTHPTPSIIDTIEFAVLMPTDSTIKIFDGSVLHFRNATDTSYIFSTTPQGSGASRSEFTYYFNGKLFLSLIVAHGGYYVNDYVPVD